MIVVFPILVMDLAKLDELGTVHALRFQTVFVSGAFDLLTSCVNSTIGLY